MNIKKQFLSGLVLILAIGLVHCSSENNGTKTNRTGGGGFNNNNNITLLECATDKDCNSQSKCSPDQICLQTCTTDTECPQTSDFECTNGFCYSSDIVTAIDDKKNGGDNQDEELPRTPPTTNATAISTGPRV